MRESGDSVVSDNSTGNQGPRSPVRSSRKGLRTGSTLQSLDSMDELDNENNEFMSTREMGQQDDDDEVELNDNYAEIFVVNQPLYIMPLNFIADVTAKNESSVQPLLVVPAPHPEIDLRKGFNIFKSKLYQNPSELSLLSGDAEVIPTNITKSSSELVSLLHSSGDGKTSKLADGVFEEKAPVLSDVLMTGEYLNQPIANLVSSNIDLSRVTQRTLRDVQRNIAEKNVQEKINQGMAEQKTGGDDEKKISSITLLKEVNQIPVLNLIADPFNEYPTQPLLPANNIAFGGQLGNWNNTASDREKLGPIALSSTNSIARKSSQSKSLLRINIHEIKLLSHNLMNDEELIYHSMKKAYVQYIAIFENKTIQYLSYRLLSIINELKRFIKENDRGITADTIDTLILHYRDLLETLPALCELRTNVDTLAANLYNNWRNIQEMRRQKGFVSTKASVTVRKVSDDDGHKLDDYADALRCTHNLVETAQRLIADYNKTLVASESTSSSSTGSLHVKQHKATSTLADDNKVNQVVEQCINELNRYKSLQPEFVLRLTDQYAMSTDQAVDVVEGKRRKMLEELRFKVVLKVNDTVITNTIAKLEYPSLYCEFNKKFDFRVINQPQNVSVDIYTFYNSIFGFDDAIFVANVPVFLPGQRVVENQCTSYSKSAEITLPTHAFTPTAAWYSFASSPDTAPGNRWTIPGVTGNTVSDPVATKPTIGAILISCDYEVGSVSSKQQSSYDGIKSDDIALIRQQITAKSPGAVTNDAYKERDFQQLMPSISNLDINDPSSDGLVRSIILGKSATTEFDSYYLFGKHFAESFSEDNQNYENYLKFSPNLRLQLLKLRDAKPYLFTDPVPLSDSVIQRSELYKKILITEGVSMTNGVDLTSMSPRADEAETEINNRLKVKSFLDRVRNSMTALKKRNIRKSITTNNVIAEVQYFYPIVLDDVETLIPARKRELKPVPKVRVPQAVQVSHCDVLVQVVGAKNIPLRQDNGVTERSSKSRRSNRGGSRGGRGSDSDGERNEPTVSDDVLDANKINEKKRARSVMEVRFQERACDTVCIEGAAPLWKQSFSYPFRPPQDDYTPSNIIMVDDNVMFTLFDEYVEDDAKRGGFLEGESTARTERRYLGSFSVPFATLYQESRIEGVFRLDAPIFNFGYVPNDIEKKKVSEDSIFETSGVDAPLTSINAYNDGFFSYYWDYFGLDRTLGAALASVGIHFKRKKRPANIDDNNYLIHAETLREFDYFACGKSSTYVNVMLTLDPMLTPPPSQHVEISTHSVYIHDRQYCAYARQFLSELKNYSIHTRKREYQLFAQSSNGLNVFIPRFLAPMKPPMGFDTRRACLHLVSTFPFMLDAHSFIGDMDLFCTAKEAWQMGAGDEEEHASMLYNYLLYLQLTGKDGTNRDRNSRVQVRGKNVNYGGYPTEEVVREESLFLVICKAVPEGSSMYVLLRDHRVPESAYSTHYSAEKFLLINACNGHIYSAADRRVPISDIYCLVTSYNIWANIQDASIPYDVEYDVLNPYHWRPFFGNRMPPPLAILQTVQEEMTYEPTDPTYALDIEKSLRQSIKNAIRRWRSRRHKSTTTFHPDASSVIHDILPMLEDYKLLGHRTQSSTTDALSVQIIQDTINEKLKTVLRNRTLTGCPIHVPYSDVDTILSKIKSMCVHETNDGDAQFVMAVRVFPLVNNLVSVWIYIGTVISKEI